ncbi:MAG TPA: retropepsin-like aspartic protease, partial [Terriglobales bacterium]|nr:retropepsin-like aspartic protease [Terriglobales bacterium]
MRCSILVAILLSLPSFAQSSAKLSTPSAAEIIAKWRDAVHAPYPRGTALLVTTSDQDGIPGHIEEWLTSSGEYRRVVKRQYDEEQFAVTDRFAERRDWNGFIRHLEGEELSRLRSAIFETEILAFGPDVFGPKEASVTGSGDPQLYALTVKTPGGKPITWYIDRKTWLPTKSVRPGEDSEITTTYSGWRKLGHIVTPQRALVAETNKPEYRWDRVSLQVRPEVALSDFAPLTPGAPDAHVDANAPPIPFDFASAHILFKMSVNGREPMWFILDTGADQEVLNNARLAEFGLKPYAKTSTTGGGGTAEYDYVAGVTLTAPGVELRNQHVAAMDDAGLEAALGVPLGGLLGYDFISRFVIDIDYEKKLITLHDPKNWTYSGKGIAVPIVYDEGIPFTHGAISVGPKHDLPAFFVIDFGAAETMTLT